MDSNATDGFRKLSHLLQSVPFPPPTFNNILMLYCKPQHGFYDLAAAVMADNPDLVASSLSKVGIMLLLLLQLPMQHAQSMLMVVCPACFSKQ